MTEVLFNSLLVALLAVPAVTLVSARWKKAASLPALLLLGALVAGAFAAVLALGTRAPCPRRPLLAGAVSIRAGH